LNYFYRIIVSNYKTKKLEEKKQQNITRLFENWSQEKLEKQLKLPISGSDREYYRINSNTKIALGVYNPCCEENIAFIEFAKHFYNSGLNVPKIYAQDMENDTYLIEDIGDETLFSYLQKIRTDNSFPPILINYYKKTLEQLPKFQIEAGRSLNYELCYPRSSFDKQSMQWDLNYFKYYFLKLAQVPFNEQKLENDFQSFMQFLLEVDRDYFLYRDFQSRNIMIKDEEVYFIDFQGGRKGALQYDLASLLYDARADIPKEIRNDLLNHYISELKKYIKIYDEKFRIEYNAYSIIRVLQAMGAFGYRGFFERKTHFLQSIPFAVRNLKEILDNFEAPIQIPHLKEVLYATIESETIKEISKI